APAMGRHLNLPAILLISLLSLFSGGTARAESTNCDGSLTGKITGNVVVPSGRSCTLYQADVEGDIRVSSNGTLLLNGEEEWSNIDGNIEAQNCSSVLLKGSVTFKGNLSGRNCALASGFVGPGTDVHGNFLCLNNNASCQAALGKVDGDVVIGSNRSRA